MTVADQPTLTDGTITLRPWLDDDVPLALAGQDDELARWLGHDPATGAAEVATLEAWREAWRRDRSVAGFVVVHEGELVGSIKVDREGDSVGLVQWALFAGQRRRGFATRAARVLVDWALTDADRGGLGLQRVEARIDAANEASLRVATRSGLQREGIQRVVPGMGDRPDASEYVVLSRLSTDPPLSEPGAFRSLLNSFLPRKRAIAQMFARDHDQRILLCQLTYKQDWDLPGGVVEVGESPQVAVAREVAEELALDIAAGSLLLTDWLPPWGGWDDALCLVFDGGTHDPSLLDGVVKQAREIRSAEFCTMAQVHERCADFTARRIEAAYAVLAGAGVPYTESGRPR